MTVELGITAFICAIFALIYLFLISPRVKNGADLDILLRDFAHRGLWSKHIPENSLSAFEAAARRGYAIELDVRPTKDGAIVVFHDDDLKRMCGRNALVRSLTLRELRSLRLKGTDEVIPSLTEVLKLVGGRVPLLIEIKGERPDPKFCLALSDLLDTYGGEFAIESFSPIILNWFKKHRPSYARGQLVTTLLKDGDFKRWAISILLSNLALNFLSRPDFIAINEKKKRNVSFLLCVHALHAGALLWTVRSADRYISCRKRGYFTIFEGFLPRIGQKGSRK